MMNALWICNLIMPEFSDVYGVRKVVVEGWMSGMYHELMKRENINIACCFPIIDEDKMINGTNGKLIYYSFHSYINKKEADKDAITEFVDIYRDYKPDIIHIWGTEYNHALVAILAAQKARLEKRVIIHLQGLVSAIIPYYRTGISDEWAKYECNNRQSIIDDELDFCKRGETEKRALLLGSIVLGRTNWDKAYYYSLVENGQYRHCDEILRSEFYKSKKWSIKSIKKHSIFVSQGSYSIKGIHLIIPGIALLKKIYPDVCLYIAGTSSFTDKYERKESPYEEYLLHLIREYGVEDNVIFIGKQDANGMIEQYLVTHVYACPSTIENSSNSIGEAQLLGVPVVATYTGGNPDLIENGKTGLLYQMDAPYMFVSCIQEIFDDDDFAEQLSEKEQDVATTRYDREKVSTNLLQIYNEVIQDNE